MKNKEQVLSQLTVIEETLKTVTMGFGQAQVILDALSFIKEALNEEPLTSVDRHSPESIAATEEYLDTLRETTLVAPKYIEPMKDFTLYKNYLPPTYYVPQEGIIYTQNIEEYFQSGSGKAFKKVKYPSLCFGNSYSYYMPSEEQLAHAYVHVIHPSTKAIGFLFTNKPEVTFDDYGLCDTTGGRLPGVNGIKTVHVHDVSETNSKESMPLRTWEKGLLLPNIEQYISDEEAVCKYLHIYECTVGKYGHEGVQYFAYLFDDNEIAETDLSKYTWMQRYYGRLSHKGKIVDYAKIKDLI